MPQDDLQPDSTLPKAYDPKNVESRWYDVWEKEGYLKPSGQGPSYTIVIPPPNVTGSLHMGHALNSTLQDILTRYHKMLGHAALWVPGTDHGGIATQNVVEKILKKERSSRYDLGREKFLERMWSWRGETGDTILGQLRRLGATLDWDKTRFTMDEVCSKAVQTAFIDLYNRGLIYRGKRLVNWVPLTQTAISDIEVTHKEVNGHLWHIRYPVVERRSKKRPNKGEKTAFDQGYLIVATTRPETMLGDTAVAVNPKDKRYKGLIGAELKLPLTGRTIPVVADTAVDKSFGSGAVKVTPSHDQTDFEIAERHNLPHISVIGFDGKMTKDAGENFEGLDRFDARKKVVEELENQDFMEKIDDYKLSLATCDRTGDVIEPLESEQWFLKMSDMAKRAIDANKKGDVRIVPESWESPYQLWLKNLKDWCISRQIWWGHRIPIWYRTKNVNGKWKRTDVKPIASVEKPTSPADTDNEKWEQDTDVLDTWFSSALWPFSVFKWPEQTEDLKKFYPTSTLVTGHEILYLWVARMIMFGLEFMGKIPFDTVYIHGIVRDKQGRKMSKSLGNVIDPLDLIKDYGADAVRFSLAQSAAPGRDLQIAKDSFIGARNFSNKIWNATRFALMNLKGVKTVAPLSDVKDHLELADRWILHTYNQLVSRLDEAMKQFDMDASARAIYEFFWSEFCDWYLEMIKPRLDPESAKQNGFSKESVQAAQTVLGTVLEGTLRLLHPFMPFITEELWQKVPKPVGSKVKHIMAASWPKPETSGEDKEAAKKMGVLKEIVTKLRNIRSEMGIPAAQKIDVVARPSDSQVSDLLKSQGFIFKSLNSRVEKLEVNPDYTRPKATAVAVVPGADLYVPLEGLIDFSKEKSRLEKELQSVKNDSDRLSKKLSNQDFLSHAPKEEISKTKGRLKESKERVKRLTENIQVLAQ